MHRRKTWQEKLADDKGLPKVVSIAPKMSKRWGSGTVAIPAPREIDELMRRVPKGKLITINGIRSAIAKKHKATIGCPIVTGIFAWVAAHAAAEQEAAGRKRITPYWRTLKSSGQLNPRYPGGVDGQRSRLESEGHSIVRKGNKHLVHDYERRLAKL